jgi:hypothetical protein
MSISGRGGEIGGTSSAKAMELCGMWNVSGDFKVCEIRRLSKQHGAVRVDDGGNFAEVRIHNDRPLWDVCDIRLELTGLSLKRGPMDDGSYCQSLTIKIHMGRLPHSSIYASYNHTITGYENILSAVRMNYPPFITPAAVADKIDNACERLVDHPWSEDVTHKMSDSMQRAVRQLLHTLWSKKIVKWLESCRQRCFQALLILNTVNSRKHTRCHQIFGCKDLLRSIVVFLFPSIN